MNYPGGKNGNGAYQHIINLIPPHRVFIELFGGSAPISRYKRPADENYIVELNTAAIDENNYPAGSIVINNCSISLLRSNYFPACKDTFIYADPPYLFSTRSHKAKIYKHEFTDTDHSDLLQLLSSTLAMVMISAYDNELYNYLLTGWHKHTYKGMTRQGPRTETLYMNYPAPQELHDYSWLGKNCTDRQRIKRKLQRKIDGLKKLPVLEQKAIIHSLLQYSHK